MITASPYSGFTYPDGKFKAVVLSFDDGIAQDRALLELFNRYGLRGTFNLNSGLLGSRATWLANQAYYIEAGALPSSILGTKFPRIPAITLTLPA